MLHFHCCLCRSFIYYENILTELISPQTERCDDEKNKKILEMEKLWLLKADSRM